MYVRIYTDTPISHSSDSAQFRALCAPMHFDAGPRPYPPLHGKI